MLEFVRVVGTEIPPSTGSGSELSTLAITLDEEVPPGSVVVIRASSQAVTESATTAPAPQSASNHHTGCVDDGPGLGWSKIVEREVARFSVAPGGVLSLWWADVTATLPAGTVITVAFAATLRPSIGSASRYDREHAGSTVSVAGAAAIAYGQDAGGVSAITLDSLTPERYRWVAAGMTNGQPGLPAYTPALVGGWSWDPEAIDNDDGLTSGNTVLWGQHRSFDGDGLTWSGSLDTTGERRLFALCAFLESAPPPTPIDYPEGTRQFLADFDTPEHGVEDASITHRPDAIVPDPRRHICTGPAAIGNLSQGIESRRWQARVNDNAVDVRVTNFGNTAWGDWTELFTYSGTVADELAIAFTLAGYPCVALERATGGGGSPEIWLRWHDGSGYEWDNLGAGRNPCMVLPNFDGDGPRCQADPEVQLFALRAGVGIARWNEGDGFTTVAGSPVGNLPTRYLNKVALLQDRRVMVHYADRSLAAGTYDPGRLFSVPFPSRKRRPSFNRASQGNLNVAWEQGGMYRSPESSTTTTLKRVYADLPDACDAVELQCANSFPSGAQPLNEGGIWTVQNQVKDGAGGGYAAGGQADFDVDVTHGNLTMNPKAFRIRTRTTVGSTTCLSPWRYWLAQPEGPTSLTSGIITTLVNCNRDAIFRTPNVAGYRFDVAGTDHGCNPCDGSPTCAASFTPGYTSYFFGGIIGLSEFLWDRWYAWQLRTVTTGAFTDADMGTTLAPSFSGEMRGRAWVGGASGAGATLPDENQYPAQWPPGDY